MSPSLGNIQLKIRRQEALVFIGLLSGRLTWLSVLREYQLPLSRIQLLVPYLEPSRVIFGIILGYVTMLRPPTAPSIILTFAVLQFLHSGISISPRACYEA